MSENNDDLVHYLDSFLEINMESSEYNEVKKLGFDEKVETMLSLHEELVLKYSILGIAYETGVDLHQFSAFEAEVLTKFDSLDDDEEMDTQMIKHMALNYK